MKEYASLRVHTCQADCDICKESGAEPTRCNRQVDHAPDGHFCRDHAKALRQEFIDEVLAE